MAQTVHLNTSNFASGNNGELVSQTHLLTNQFLRAWKMFKITDVVFYNHNTKLAFTTRYHSLNKLAKYVDFLAIFTIHCRSIRVSTDVT